MLKFATMLIVLVASCVSTLSLDAQDTQQNGHFNLWLNAFDDPKCPVDEDSLRLFAKDQASEMNPGIDLHLSWNDDRTVIKIYVYTKSHEISLGSRYV